MEAAFKTIQKSYKKLCGAHFKVFVSLVISNKSTKVTTINDWAKEIRVARSTLFAVLKDLKRLGYINVVRTGRSGAKSIFAVQKVAGGRDSENVSRNSKSKKVKNSSRKSSKSKRNKS